MGGWLKFFLIIMGIGAVLSLVLHAIRFNIYAYYIGMGHWMTVLGAVSDWLLFAGLCVLAGYAILSFIGKRPNSVALARAYLIIVLSVNLLNLLSGLLAGFPPAILLAVRVIAWGIIWLVFLSMSTQVKELIAPGTRKMYAWEIVRLAIIGLPAVMYIGIGFMNRLIQSFA